MAQQQPNRTDFTAQYKELATRFDQAAKQYDTQYGPPSGSRPGSPLVCWLRDEHLSLLRVLISPGAALLDIGCGTGEESLMLAQEGFAILGIDVSPGMVWQAQAKAASLSIRRGVSFKTLAAGQLASLDERGPFQGAYASLGTLNTEPDLAGVAEGLHGLLEPGAPFVATVMNRHCLYESVAGISKERRIKRPARWAEGRAGATSVIAPVKFYNPGEFAGAFKAYFSVESVIAFPLWLPPVHLHDIYRSNLEKFGRLEARERRTRSWRWFRARGDHFLMVLRHNI
ncbi:MAG: methyltransferase domain-containing protein [Chloroflexi bacterium]|nr:methyltransferase domain-containing protein [Chloroflexota bacterium]